MYYPTLEDFREKAQHGNLIPVYKSILADMETPVSAFYKIGGDEYAFLLESVEGGENLARYSFLGANPAILFQSKGDQVKITEVHTDKTVECESTDALTQLEALMNRYQPVQVEGLPHFHGGVVGYLSYDVVRFVEELPDNTDDDRDLPDCLFMTADTLLVFDHVNHRIKVIANAHIDDDVDAAYTDAVNRIDLSIAKLKRPLPMNPNKEAAKNNTETQITSNFTKAGYESAVLRAKEYVAAGDIIQVVPSQRFSLPISVDAFEVYRALRTVNPSPYMYHLKFGDLQLVGASPEMMVRVENGLVETRPIAGTRPRGQTPAEDVTLAEELLADPKERAEHVMLVDLGRNDLGRVCEYHTVHVSEMMVIERYSHVMHIVSHVEGQLREGQTAFDVIRACLPAGTLSGAPKIRAMEIIDELEPTRRGTYGGAVGYFSFSGSTDTAITIRTLVIKDSVAYVQAGGGIVADSVPETEYEETLNKAQAVLNAIRLAEAGLE
jgi:anthranilate synthase component 1